MVRIGGCWLEKLPVGTMELKPRKGLMAWPRFLEINFEVNMRRNISLVKLFI